MIAYGGYLYENASQSDIRNKLKEYTKLVADSISILLNKGTRIPRKVSISTILQYAGVETPVDLRDIVIEFSGDSRGYSYTNGPNIIQLPSEILTTKRMSKNNYIGLSHELAHHFQHKFGNAHDEGTYTNPEQRGSRKAYVNDRDEINAMLDQIAVYISSNEAFADEVGSYDFGPFVETVISKILYEQDPTDYLDNQLSDDNRTKVLEFLYFIWKKIKST